MPSESHAPGRQQHALRAAGPPVRLPRLAFGEARAEVEHEPSTFHDHVATAKSRSFLCVPMPRNGNFRLKWAACELDELRLIAIASTPVTFKVAESAATTLLLPLCGNVTA